MMNFNLSEIVLSPDSTIHEALEKIDKLSLRMALVTDDDFRLLGVVTDGDIRRALLKKASIDDPISSLMNRTPVVVDSQTTRREKLQLMQSKSLLTLPIVEDGILVGAETLQSALIPQKRDNPVFLMAGGFGTRLRPLTDNCPKPLLKVGDKPMLEIILQHFVKQGFHRFYISTHYLPEMIRAYFKDGSDWGVSIEYVHETSPLGTGGALGLLPSDIGELPLIMMNGDILTNMNFERLLDYHKSHHADATMCVREYEYQIPYGVVESTEGIIEQMVEKPTYHFDINTGIYVVNPSVIKNVKTNVPVGMPTLLEKEIATGNKVAAYPLYEYWLDIGQMDDYKRAQTDILNLDF